MLGKRDPDDQYAQSELSVFQALADQTAVALTNIDQAERLRTLYQANVDRHEAERAQLARVLHDEVLHHMAALALAVDGTEPPPQFEHAYRTVTARTRQLITGLRPAMLTYGLGAALEEFADDLSERVGDTIAIHCTIADSPARFIAKVEERLLRIVQEACENALYHAHARTICIAGTITADQIVIVVEDDGVGFAAGNHLDLTSLMANQHFGLVGMYERAALIEAELTINSEPGIGTRVTVSWTPGATD